MGWFTIEHPVAMDELGGHKCPGWGPTINYSQLGFLSGRSTRHAYRISPKLKQCSLMIGSYPCLPTSLHSLCGMLPAQLGVTQ